VNKNLDDNFPVLKKLRKLVVEDIENINQHKGLEDNFSELQEWLIEIDNKIKRIEKKKLILQAG
jgi:hypothetical protein